MKKLIVLVVLLAGLAALPAQASYWLPFFAAPNMTYAPGGATYRSPLLTMVEGEGNCLEQSMTLLFCLYVADHYANERLTLRVYYPTDGSPYGHATAVVDGVEYDLTNGLAEGHWRIHAEYSFLTAYDRYISVRHPSEPKRTLPDIDLTLAILRGSGR